MDAAPLDQSASLAMSYHLGTDLIVDVLDPR